LTIDLGLGRDGSCNVVGGVVCAGKRERKVLKGGEKEREGGYEERERGGEDKERKWRRK
jgi:hypothetical protein